MCFAPPQPPAFISPAFIIGCGRSVGKGDGMKTFTRIAMLTGMLVLLACNHAFANPCPPGNPPTNCAPPTGAILDLNGTAINHQYQQFSIDFVASQLVTNISFAFREDPAFIFLDDVDVHDTTVVGPNLIQNGGFESGPLNAN